MDRHPGTGVDYEEDFVLWLERQVAALRAQRFGELDVVNLAMEVESIVRSEHRQVGSRLALIIRHLLKCQYQPARKSKSWHRTLITQRQAIERVCEDSPSLRPLLFELAETEYWRAVRFTSKETGLARTCFPPALPFTVEQLLDEDFLP